MTEFVDERIWKDDVLPDQESGRDGMRLSRDDDESVAEMTMMRDCCEG
jgi:hypothetical protein